ncbi:hypothetical protein DEU56DRAFT_789510 [Suillus clintonianus]|uniref:uncharacterized protein n=1 Tax=Suillus clintonianus TaxID=1904413 RepID=UPI001B87A248|nr:uncharacterized protein DEU56DRAFT_789510 [Suillus clintonianus]KAG2145221.1 hypothetical protein DEU56DRAFT_789510 [Suillus clintonianus]
MILGDFSACIIVDGQELPEYDVVVSSTPTENRITCWIASEEGKKFGVRIKVLAMQSSSVCSTVSVDGVQCRNRILALGWVDMMEYTCLSDNYVSRDFMFSHIELTDDDSMLDDQTANDIGQIVSKFRLGNHRVTKDVVKLRMGSDHTLRVRGGKVHERSKKACSHRVAFGEEVLVQRRPVPSCKFVPDNSPSTVFAFKYTRLDILQAMGVAPPTSNIQIAAKTEHSDETEVMNGPSESSPSNDVKPLARIRELEVTSRFGGVFPSCSFFSCRWSSSAYVNK